MPKRQLSPEAKEKKRVYMHGYNQRPEIKEKRRVQMSAYTKERRKTDPEFRERVNKYTREYHSKRYRTDSEFKEYVKGKWKEKEFEYTVCPILKRHANTLREDPHRLQTEFILSLMGRG